MAGSPALHRGQEGQAGKWEAGAALPRRGSVPGTQTCPGLPASVCHGAPGWAVCTCHIPSTSSATGLTPVHFHSRFDIFLLGNFHELPFFFPKERKTS